MRLGRLLVALGVAFLVVPFLVFGWGALGCDSSGNELYDAGFVDASPPPDASVYLSALNVVSATSPDGSLLVPSFSPTVNDYYVRCNAGANSLTVSMTASPGGMSALIRPDTSTPAPSQTLSFSVQANAAIVVAATRAGATSDEYWVRCLPPDFPTMLMDLHPMAGVPPPGYYLVGTFSALTGVGYAIVLDVRGVPVWYYRENSGATAVDNGVSVVDNIISGAVSFKPYKSPLGYEIRHLSPAVTTGVRPKGDLLDPHELRALPNGNFLVFIDNIEIGDLTGYDAHLPDGGMHDFGPSSMLRPCDIAEVDPSGKVVWSWYGKDHFDAVKDCVFPVLVDSYNVNGNAIPDPFHCNSIDVDPASGNLLVSGRNMDSVFYIDRQTSQVLWKMGGSAYTKENAPYLALTPSEAFHRQHDARLAGSWSTDCGGTGQVSLFDDETATGNPARGVVYNVTVGGGSGDHCGAPGAKLGWEYAGPGTASNMGSFRISSDGSRVIGWGHGPVPGLVFTEVDGRGRDLLDFHFTDDNASYRSIKVPLTAFDIGVLRETAGKP